MTEHAELSSRIAGLVKARRYRFSSHAEKERDSDQITLDEFEHALGAGPEVIENYPTDPRGASCLALGLTAKGEPIHAVCGLSVPNVIVVITIYRPNPSEWLNWRTRR
jgi:hypothetical protein